MNRYTTSFYANCPNNGIRIHYTLSIATYKVLSVEELVAACEATSEGFHEEIADAMFARFGGGQNLEAEHHGVTIETTRGV